MAENGITPVVILRHTMQGRIASSVLSNYAPLYLALLVDVIATRVADVGGWRPWRAASGPFHPFTPTSIIHTHLHLYNFQHSLCRVNPTQSIHIVQVPAQIYTHLTEKSYTPKRSLWDLIFRAPLPRTPLRLKSTPLRYDCFFSLSVGFYLAEHSAFAGCS